MPAGIKTRSSSFEFQISNLLREEETEMVSELTTLELLMFQILTFCGG